MGRRRPSLNLIAKRFGLDLIVLFGSRAVGRERPDSDTDVAVRPRPRSRPPTPAWEIELTEALAGALDAPSGIDLVRLDRVSPLLLFQVASKGCVLYEARRGLFLRFRLYAARRYDDNRKFFDAIDRYVAGRCR